MNLLPGTVNTTLTTDTVIGNSGKPTRIFSATLKSGTSASTVILKNGTTSSGTAYAQIDGIAGQCVIANWAGGLRFPNGLFADTDANISYLTVSFSEEF